MNVCMVTHMKSSVSHHHTKFSPLAIQREEDKLKKSLKEAAKKGEKDVCVILAKDVVHARKAINKIYTSKTHISSVQMQMKNQLGNPLC